MYMRDINRRRKLEPYYVPAVAGDSRVTKSRAATATAKFNPFTGPATYSQKYNAPVRTAPDFTGKSWRKYSFLEDGPLNLGSILLNIWQVHL